MQCLLCTKWAYYEIEPVYSVDGLFLEWGLNIFRGIIEVKIQIYKTWLKTPFNKNSSQIETRQLACIAYQRRV